MVGLMALLLVTYTFHCTWVTSEAYSSPSIVLSAKQHDGSRVIFDDFREAYYWLRQNTPEVTWSCYFATRMLLRSCKLHRIVFNTELKSCCRGVCLFCEWFLSSLFFWRGNKIMQLHLYIATSKTKAKARGWDWTWLPALNFLLCRF